MTVDMQTLEKIRTHYPGSSWAIWSEMFPGDGCVEESPEELVTFIEANRDRLTPTVVFLALNPSGEHPAGFSNFHSPKSQHFDDRLKAFIQDNNLDRLTGAFMADLVPDTVDPDSENVTPETADVDRFLEQLRVFDAPEHYVICFTAKTFEALQTHFDASPTDDPYSIESFEVTTGEKTLHIHRVWFYGLYGVYADKVQELEEQLIRLNDALDDWAA
jgi:hypothetical protein